MKAVSVRPALVARRRAGSREDAQHGIGEDGGERRDDRGQAEEEVAGLGHGWRRLSCQLRVA